MALRIKLREPTGEDYRRAATKDTGKLEIKDPVVSEPLPEGEIKELLERSPDISVKEDDEKDWHKREKTLPPPRKGEMIKQSFPPEVKLEKPAALMAEEQEHMRELKVLRYMPEAKDLNTVSQVVVTFNQPMVPVTGVEDLKKIKVPVEISPKIEGEWRWVGTKTVKWKPTYRLPKSTIFKVVVPKGVKSEKGCELKKEVSFEFTTIPIRISRKYPYTCSWGHSQEVGAKDPVCFVEFNQKIDKEKIWKFLSVTKSGKKLKIRPLKPEEVEEILDRDKKVMKTKRPSMYNHYKGLLSTYTSKSATRVFESSIWFTMQEPVPLESTFEVKLLKGCDCGEGPRTTPTDQQFNFQSYAPFVKYDHYPKARDKIVPNQSWSITMNNNIELDEFDPDKHVKIVPSVIDASRGIFPVITANGKTISIQAQTKGQTKYSVLLQPELSDIFGQTLKKEVKTDFKVGRARQQIYGFHDGQMIVHDKTMSKPEFSVVTINVPKFRYCVFQVEPWEYHKSILGQDYWRYSCNQYGTVEKYLNCGVKVADEQITVKKDPDTLIETKIDLSPYLQHTTYGIGQLMVYVEPCKQGWTRGDYKYRPKLKTWVQVTDIAIDCFNAVGNEMYCYSSSLATGKPLGRLDATPSTPVASAGQLSSVDQKKKKVGEKKGILGTIFGQVGSVLGLNEVGDDMEEFGKVMNPLLSEAKGLPIYSIYSQANMKAGMKDYKKRMKSVIGEEDGTAFFANQTDYNAVVAVRRGKDVAFVTGVSSSGTLNATYLSYIINDRKLYKPNEKVSVKGIIRHQQPKGWKKLITVPKQDKVSWTAYDPRGNKIANGDTKTNVHGSFFLSFTVPDNANLGTGWVDMRFKGHSMRNNYDIQEFRTPEFKSSLKLENQGPHLVGSIQIFTANASYYSGGGLSGCKANYYVNQSATSYTPPGYGIKKFNFSNSYVPLARPEAESSKRVDEEVLPILPIEHDSPFGSDEMDTKLSLLRDLIEVEKTAAETVEEEGSPGDTKEFEGSTDGNGDHKLAVECGRPKMGELRSPVKIDVDLKVQDLSRQVMSSKKSYTVHPSSLYVGLKTNKYYVKAGEALPVDVVVTDIDGTTQEGRPVKVRVVRRYCERKGYKWIEKEIEEDVLDFKSTKEARELTIKLEKPGSYFFVAEVRDEEGRPNYASTTMWVPGGRDMGPSSDTTRLNTEELKVIGNKEEYEVGDEVKMLIVAPFDCPASGILWSVCNGFAEKKRFELEKENAVVVSVPVKDHYVPGFTIHVFVTGKGERIDLATGRKAKRSPSRPASAVGSYWVSVPAKKRKLGLEVTPEKAIMAPGEEGVVKVKISSEDEKVMKQLGTSVVSCVIVDEAVINLAGYSLSDPLSSFVTGNNMTLNQRHLREDVRLKNWSSIVPEVPPEPIIAKPRCCCFKNCSCPFSCCRSKCCECCEGCDYECSMHCAPCCMEDEDDCVGCCVEEKCDDFACFGEDEMQGKECECAASAPVDAKKKKKTKPKIKLRTNFDPLACFINDTIANEEGIAEFKFKLPDNLTNYRVWIIATNGAYCYGLGESGIKAQLPIAVRPSLPRFLNFGDVCDFTVVIQNQTLKEVVVDVACRMTNLRLTDVKMQGVRVKIPYTKRAELRFPVKTHKCGTGRFQVVASLTDGKFSDACEKDLPIFTPSTSEAFATYGELDGNGAVVQPILPPEDVYNQFGGMTITTSSTALQALTDAFLYLTNYEFDCVEQCSSRVLSIAALQDIMCAFNVPQMPTKKELRAVVASSMKKIKSAQRTDGAFGFWTILSRVNIYLSIHVAHALIRVKEQGGYKVDETVLNRSKSFLQNCERYMNSWCNWYGPYSRASLRSFALYVLCIYAQQGLLSNHERDKILGQAEDVWNKYKDKHLTHEGKAWVAYAVYYVSEKKAEHPIVKEAIKFFMNNVNETPETANFITSYGDDGKLVMLHSNRRTDGILLEILISIDEKNYLIPKMVKGLLAHRKKGRWGNTQESIYILLALKKYFKVYEKLVPDFLCRVWLGDDYGGEMKFKGREVDYKVIEIPMKSLVPDMNKKPEKKDLIVYKEGQGRLYYRLGMDYAPKSLDLKALDYGFIVSRSYEGVTEKEHCKRDKETGIWTFKAGELVKCKLVLTNVSRRYHVALVDFIPAGCEVLNPELKGADSAPDIVKKGEQISSKQSVSGSNTHQSPYIWQWWWGFRPWYEHVNLRDERVEAFASYLYCGTHEYEYIMRATTLGKFVVPPAKAEEMYAPELFGRSASEKVNVE